MLGKTPLVRVRLLAWDALALIAGTIVVGILSGAQQWATTNTPDSEFYGSLGVFGSEVTDRAPTSVYYWTRLGYIGPLRLLTSVFGVGGGQSLFRLLLILTVLTAFFTILRPRLGRVAGVLAACALGVNTVLLAFIGNTYVTGTVLALSMLALALSIALTHPDAQWPRIVVGGFFSGFLLVWVLMCNPYAALLLLFGLLFVLLGRVVTNGLTGARVSGLFGLCALPGAALSYGAFILVGTQIFPGLDWLATYRYWNSVIRQSDYLVDALSWTLDNALLVPASVTVMSLASVAILRLVRSSDERAANGNPGDFPRVVIAALLSCGSIAFALLYLRFSPGVTLEWTQYQAMLWAPTLVAFALVMSVVLAPHGRRALVVALAGCLLIGILAGHWSTALSLDRARLLAIAATLCFGLVLWMNQRQPPRSTLVALTVALALFGLIPAGFQVLQNSRRSPYVDDPAEYYSNAFLPNAIAAQTASEQDAERWLLSRTSRNDVVMTWVDANWAIGEESLMPLAAYQLDGPNRITSGRAIEGTDLQRALDTRPTVIAMYVKSVGIAAGFRAGLPTSWHATDPECRGFPWPDPMVPTAYVCLTRIAL